MVPESLLDAALTRIRSLETAIDNMVDNVNRSKYTIDPDLLAATMAAIKVRRYQSDAAVKPTGYTNSGGGEP